MNKQIDKKAKSHEAVKAELITKIPECYHLPKGTKREIVYVFQGGGALGTYQVGAFEALQEHGYHPDMLVGISIGAVNAAIIAGNPVEKRREKLHAFWNKITTRIPFPMFTNLGLAKFHNWWSATTTLCHGQPGFFTPKAVNPWLLADTTPDQLSFYDTTPLRETLQELIDFEYLNQCHVRLCIGGVELSSGEFIFWENNKQEITVDHIMAACALPPGFPPIKIDEAYYIDGGVFSNTPIFKVVDEFAEKEQDIKNVLCFMVDLFSLNGPLPHSLDGLLERVKDIRFGTHAKRADSLYATTQNLSHAIHFLTNKLTPEQLKDPKVKEVIRLGFAHRLDVIHLIYRSEKGTELASKDYEFSVESANKHRLLGYNNTKRLIEEQEVEWMKKHHSGITVYTLATEKSVSFKV